MWAGGNIVNLANGQGLNSPANALLRTDFDNPSRPADSTLGSNVALDLEYTTMGGDSGSAIYLEKNGLRGQIAGVLSGGNGSLYGDQTVYVRTSRYITWMTDTILANPDTRNLSLDIPLQNVEVGSPLDIFVNTASTESALSISNYTLLSGPEGATVDSETGRFQWTPGALDAGLSFQVTVRVEEEGFIGNSVDSSFQINVLDEGCLFWQWSGAPTNWTGVSATPQPGFGYEQYEQCFGDFY